MMPRVVDHDPTWGQKYQIEADRLAAALRSDLIRVHHIGSTSILRIKAKPIIDMLLEITSLEAIDQKTPVLLELGYEAMGEFGIPGRRYFRLNDALGRRTHHVHAFESSTGNVRRHLAFRDYMRAHPAIAEEYSVLKERLASAHPNDMNAYMDGKDAFIKEHERRALDWAQLNP